MEQRLSPMARKFLHAQGRAWEPDPNVNYGPPDKELYFFYGSLMDPSMLAKVLQLRDPPELLPAKVIGYCIKLWGPYPALLDGPTGSAVYGMAYEVQSPSDKKRLADYETNHYKVRSCRIHLQDGSIVLGRTFMWNADKALLKEGTFDLKDWQMSRLEK